MYSSLNDGKFLARSSNRVAVLDALDESSRTPHELREVTGASRMTVHRILDVLDVLDVLDDRDDRDDLDDRGWIIRKNGQCESTHPGAIIADEFPRLLSNLAVPVDLGDALSWLPTEAFVFDLVHLQDATVLRTSSWEDHTGVVRHVADLIYDATHIWGATTGVSHSVADAIWETTGIEMTGPPP